MKKKKRNRPRDGAERQVDVEAPAPRQVRAVGEGAAHERPGDRGYAVHATDEAHEDGARLERHSVADDEDGAREDARGAEAGDGAAEDERRRVGGDAADERAELEDEKGGHVGPLDGVEGVDLAVDELEAARGQQVDGHEPANVVEGVELVGDAGDGGRDDGVVQGHAEDGEAEGDCDEHQLQPGRILVVVAGSLVDGGGPADKVDGLVVDGGLVDGGLLFIEAVAGLDGLGLGGLGGVIHGGGMALGEGD